MKHQLSELDIKFKFDFEQGSLPLAKFDHRAHIRLAYIYLLGSDTNSAVKNMRVSLCSYLQQNSIDVSKYSETITRAWIIAVRHFIELTDNSVSADDFIDKNERLLDPNIMLSHYSPKVLFSDRARKSFVRPDIEPIPKHPGIA